MVAEPKALTLKPKFWTLNFSNMMDWAVKTKPLKLTPKPRVFEAFDMKILENTRDLTLNPLEAPLRTVRFRRKMAIKD